MISTIKISSLELPHDDVYELVKIKGKAGQFNMVFEGQSSIGDLFSNPIAVGKRCSVAMSISSGISTSPVTGIELTDKPSEVLIYTESGSTYKLINLDMVKDAVKKV